MKTVFVCVYIAHICIRLKKIIVVYDETNIFTKKS
jgi:hypothetical protein